MSTTWHLCLTCGFETRDPDAHARVCPDRPCDHCGADARNGACDSCRLELAKEAA